MRQSPSASQLNQSSISKASLAQFDFTSLEENDPVLQGGFISIYDYELQFKLQLAEKDEQATDFPNQETLRVRILVQGAETNLEQMKIELSSDNDLFFHFLHKVDAQSYDGHIQPQQQLHCKFLDYPAVCVKNFDKCLRESHQFIPVLTIMPDGQARVDILQLTEFKSVELISFEFISSDEETIRNTVKQKLGLMENKLKDINDVVKVKNPSLLLQIQKQKISNTSQSKSK